MKKIQCQCGKNILVRGGIVGLTDRFPQEIYLCSCGTAYRPNSVGCLLFNKEYQENSADPTIMSAKEYQMYKKKESKVAIELGLNISETIIERKVEETGD